MDYDIDPSDNSDDPGKLGPMWAWGLIYLFIYPLGSICTGI